LTLTRNITLNLTFTQCFILVWWVLFLETLPSTELLFMACHKNLAN
jgi:hypothetical protein